MSFVRWRRAPSGTKISKLVRSGTPHKQAVAIALSMKAKVDLDPRGGYKRSRKPRKSKQKKKQTKVEKNQSYLVKESQKSCNRKKCTIKASSVMQIIAHTRYPDYTLHVSVVVCAEKALLSVSCAPYI